MKKTINLGLVLMIGLNCFGLRKANKEVQIDQDIHSKSFLVDIHNYFLAQTMDWDYAYWLRLA